MKARMTELSPSTQMTILLTARWGTSAVKPLTNSEFSEFARWLEAVGGSPSAFLSGEFPPDACPLPLSRLSPLLERGAELFPPLERWLQAGLWALSGMDAEYPPRFKGLPFRPPSLLFGAGSLDIFAKPALAVVGSRNASEERLAFAKAAGAACALADVCVISGGARGVDFAAMSGCIEAGGCSAGVLADSLLKESRNPAYRRALIEKRLCLLSEVHPEARFEAGSAMSRNRLIHLCADASLLIECEPDAGGTWRGALEALRGGKSVYILKGAKAEARLVERGAVAIGMEQTTQPLRLIEESRALERAKEHQGKRKPATGTLSLFEGLDDF